eukprot:2760698-Alexandrium_andersonii.AAC.1
MTRCKAARLLRKCRSDAAQMPLKRGGTRRAERHNVSLPVACAGGALKGGTLRTPMIMTVIVVVM